MNNPMALNPHQIDGFLPGEHADYDRIQKAIYENYLFFD
jgi:hypothetical protein